MRRQYIFTFHHQGVGWCSAEFGAETLGQAYEAFLRSYPDDGTIFIASVTCLGS